MIRPCRTFQALRIAVNDELKSLEIGLSGYPTVCDPRRERRDCFHSLEDRRVKEAFREDARLEVLTCRKPIVAGPEETAQNPRGATTPAPRRGAEIGAIKE